MRRIIFVVFAILLFLLWGSANSDNASGLASAKTQTGKIAVEKTQGVTRSDQPDTILFDDGVADEPLLDPGLWSGVRFTPVLDFELRTIYFAVLNPFNQSAGCTLFVVADSGGHPSSTVISGPHYVAGPLSDLAWIQVDLPESLSFFAEQDFHVICGPQPGGLDYPDDSTQGWWAVLDSGTTTYRSHISSDRESGWVTDSTGDFFIRVGGEMTSDTTRYTPGYLLVRFKEGTPEQAIDSINALMGTQTVYYDSLLDHHFLEIVSRDETKRVLSKYLQVREAELAAADLKLELDQFSERTPDDPVFPNQWNLQNRGQLGAAAPSIDADIDAPQMWRMHTDCSNIVIGILDTGGDLGHPDLVGPPSNLWTNPNEDPGDNDDEDGNGHRDDMHGVDFDRFLATGGLIACPPTDDNGHGTAVAGIVGAVGNNTTDIAGICWRAQLMMLKARTPRAMAHAINYADNMKTAHGVDIRIINQSSGVWTGGGGLNAALFAAAAARLAANNILWIVSAGNRGWNLDALPAGIPAGARRYPAMLPNANVICVAASDENDNVAGDIAPVWASNTGPATVDLAAPGKNVPSLRRVAAGGGTRMFGGTSAAAPHVTGAAGLIWSLDPALALADVRNILLNGAPHPSLPSAAVEQKPAFVGNTVTEGRLRAPVNGDFGDAVDPPYPTNWPRYFGAGNDGPRHLDCGLEWLGYDVSVERDDVDPLDTDGGMNAGDNDGFDDGVVFFPPYFCKGLAPRDRVDVTLTAAVPTPPAGANARYGGAPPGGRYLYLSAWFDFNDDGDWLDVFRCPPGAAGNAPEHILWQAAAGPGVVNGAGFHPFPDHVIVIDPSAWGAAPGAQASRVFICEFYSPDTEDVADTIQTRFRLEYDDQVAPVDFKGTFTDYTRFGEVEDYEVVNVVDFGDAPDNEAACETTGVVDPARYPTEVGTPNAAPGRDAPYHLPPPDPDTDYWFHKRPTYEVAPIEACSCDWYDCPPCDWDNAVVVLCLNNTCEAGIFAIPGPSCDCDEWVVADFWNPAGPLPTNVGFFIYEVTRGDSSNQPGYINLAVDHEWDGDYGGPGEWIEIDRPVTVLPGKTRLLASPPFPVPLVWVNPNRWDVYAFWSRFLLSSEQILPSFPQGDWDGSGLIGGYIGGETEDIVTYTDPEQDSLPPPMEFCFNSLGQIRVTMTPSDSNCLDGTSIELSSEGMEPTIVRQFGPHYYITGIDVYTEILQMELTGYDSVLGTVVVRERTDRMSLGKIDNVEDDGYGHFLYGESFFDVYVEVELPDYGLLFNTGEYPVRVDARSITSLPPWGDSYVMPVEEPSVPMYVAGTSDQVGWICYAEHIPTDSCGGAYDCGDVNGDGIINVGDIVFLVSYLYKSGPAPDPACVGDVNCDAIVNVGDVVYLVSYLYKGGPVPCPECCSLKSRGPGSAIQKTETGSQPERLQ